MKKEREGDGYKLKRRCERDLVCVCVCVLEKKVDRVSDGRRGEERRAWGGFFCKFWQGQRE